tara:strand:- start:272 stop:877 length:606 start_codon:yes stop_codon:yes gene_type:complete
MQHKVFVRGSTEELEVELNRLSLAGYACEKITSIPGPMGLAFFCHMVKEGDPVEEVAKEEVVKAVKKEPDLAHGADARRGVYSLWAKLFKKEKTRFRVNGSRDKKIKRALKDYTVEELKASITGHSLNEWRHGAPNRCELATLLRDEQNIDAGIDINENGGIKDGNDRLGNGKGNKTLDFVESSRSGKSGGFSFDGSSLRE